MRWIVVAIIVLGSFSSKALENSAIIFSKHCIYAGPNILGGYSANYEYYFFEKQKRFFKTGGIRIAGGQEWGTGFDTFFVGVLYNQFYGSQNNHFEFGLGAALAVKYSNPTKNNLVPLPALTFGYRYQKPGGKFLLKTGMGVPEVIYVGIGVSL